MVLMSSSWGAYDGSLFSFDLKSGRVRKLYEGECNEDGLLGRVPCVVPYTSFCTPGTVQLCLVYDFANVGNMQIFSN